MSTKKFKLLCLENPLLDIQGKGYVYFLNSRLRLPSLFVPSLANTDSLWHRDESMLQQYGLKLDDTLLAEPHQMDLYDDLIKNQPQDCPTVETPTQNTARGAQYMLPPDSVWYIGCVGDDEYARILREKCAEQGASFVPFLSSPPTLLFPYGLAMTLDSPISMPESKLTLP